MSAHLTRRRVEAIRARIENSAGLIDVRRAALMDRHGATVRDTDVARWLERGEELMRASASPEDARLPDYDVLCLELAQMASVRGAAVMQIAGQTAQRILKRTDHAAAPSQVSLIKHLSDVFAVPVDGSPAARADVVPVSTGELDIPQAEMDAMSEEGLCELERLLAERRRITEKILAVRASERVLRAGGTAPALH